MDAERKKILVSFLPFGGLVLILFLCFFIYPGHGTSAVQLGVFPRLSQGLKGILFMPLIHSDQEHLISNSIPLFLLGAMLVYFYRELSLKVSLMTWLFTGFWLWLGGRPAWHIGASGIVYGLASFLFFSGLIRQHTRLLALSLLVVFLYGGMIWGLFPLIKGMSWEGHLFGSLSGMLLAWAYRGTGLQKQEYVWEDEQEEETGTDDSTLTPDEANPSSSVKYIYKDKSEAGNEFSKIETPMKQIEHIGIAVSNLEESRNKWARLLGEDAYKTEMVEAEGVKTLFFKIGSSKIELLEATRPDSPIAGFIEKRGPGIHHIAFEVDDIVAEMKRLKELGYHLLNESPKIGADNKLVCFVHPKDMSGVLVELTQERKD